MTTSSTKTFLKLGFAIAVLALIATSALAITLGWDAEPGIWVQTSNQDCPNDLVCMEWKLHDGGTNGESCCQPASVEGSTTFITCNQGHFRH